MWSKDELDDIYTPKKSLYSHLMKFKYTDPGGTPRDMEVSFLSTVSAATTPANVPRNAIWDARGTANDADGYSIFLTQYMHGASTSTRMTFFSADTLSMFDVDVADSQLTYVSDTVTMIYSVM